MEERDTIELLKECDAGVKMGISAIDEVLESVQNDKLKRILEESKKEHEKYRQETENLLQKDGESEKEPSPIAKGMSWIKTNAKMAMDSSDETIADLITDGCHMGIKSLQRYLNQYKAADEKSKDIARNIISIEDDLLKGLRNYL